jgi:hypothetical protein
MKARIAEYALSTLFILYAAFWLGVYAGERKILRAWIPFRRAKPKNKS